MQRRITPLLERVAQVEPDVEASKRRLARSGQNGAAACDEDIGGFVARCGVTMPRGRWRRSGASARNRDRNHRKHVVVMRGVGSQMRLRGWSQ
jgi:hypothetical protein